MEFKKGDIVAINKGDIVAINKYGLANLKGKVVCEANEHDMVEIQIITTDPIFYSFHIGTILFIYRLDLNLITNKRKAHLPEWF